MNVFVSEEPEETHKGDQELRIVHQDYTALMERRGSRALCTYSTTGAYTEGQYIMHPKFGEGYVLAVRSPSVKMEVLFEDMRRLLVCGSIIGARTEEEDAQPQEESERSDKRSFTVSERREYGPLAGPKALRPSADVPFKCPVCGRVVNPFNLARSLDGRILGCFHCR